MVGSHRFELCRARVDRLEDRTDPPGVSDLTDLFFTRPPQLRDFDLSENPPRLAMTRSSRSRDSADARASAISLI